MSITPADIAAQQFPIAFRGYNVEAVDTFLDRVQADLAEILTDRVGDAAPTGAAEESAGPASTVGANALTPTAADHLSAAEGGPAARALRTLMRAEQMAEQLTADALAEADAIRAQAQVEADEIIAAARAESSRIDAEVQLRRRQEVAGLLVQAQRLRSEIDRLGGLERQYREAMQALLSEQQRLLGQRPDVDDATAARPAFVAETIDPAA